MTVVSRSLSHADRTSSLERGPTRPERAGACSSSRRTDQRQAESEYDRVFSAMPPEMSRSECKLLWDILNMFRVLGASVDRLSADDRAALGDDNEPRLRFGGFDLNDSREGRLLGYVHHLVDTDRWTEIKPRLAEIGDNGNSHSPRLPTYERMLAVYKPIFEDGARSERGHSIDAWLFTIDELKQVAKAWAWPGRS